MEEQVTKYKEVDRTVEMFCSGIEFAAKWHLEEAQKWEDKCWTERARDHRDHASDLRSLLHSILKGKVVP